MGGGPMTMPSTCPVSSGRGQLLEARNGLLAPSLGTTPGARAQSFSDALYPPTLPQVLGVGFQIYLVQTYLAYQARSDLQILPACSTLYAGLSSPEAGLPLTQRLFTIESRHLVLNFSFPP